MPKATTKPSPHEQHGPAWALQKCSVLVSLWVLQDSAAQLLLRPSQKDQKFKAFVDYGVANLGNLGTACLNIKHKRKGYVDDSAIVRTRVRVPQDLHKSQAF